MNNTLECIVCKCSLESAFSNTSIEDDVTNQPYKGTVFISHGHYGSTVFDPMVPSVHLEINVCDNCLLKEAKSQRVMQVTTRTPPSEHFYAWPKFPVGPQI